MSGSENRQRLANEPDFQLGELTVSPSSARVRGQGVEARAEAQTMAALVVLARANGATVTREDLVAACWQGRAVSDDAISRTIAKVRSLARTVSPPAFVVETVPKIGYRLTIGATEAEQPAQPVSAARWPSQLRSYWQPAAFVVLIAIISTALWGTFATSAQNSRMAVGSTLPTPTSVEMLDALLVLDENRVEQYLRRGWDPNWNLDSERNAALHDLMMACERNRYHDQASVLRIAQLLVREGADPAKSNKWGDTPLTIASSPRYCGPDHPVVAYLKSVDNDAAQQFSRRR